MLDFYFPRRTTSGTHMWYSTVHTHPCLIAFTTTSPCIYDCYLQFWLTIITLDGIILKYHAVAKFIPVIIALNSYGLKFIKGTGIDYLHEVAHLVTFINTLAYILHDSMKNFVLVLMYIHVILKVTVPLTAIIRWIIQSLLWIWRHVINVIGTKIMTLDTSWAFIDVPLEKLRLKIGMFIILFK